MPRYHFDVDNGGGFAKDEEGRELPDLETARAEALAGARSLIADDVTNGHLDLSGRLDVRNGEGTLLFSLPFSEAVRVTG